MAKLKRIGREWLKWDDSGNVVLTVRFNAQPPIDGVYHYRYWWSLKIRNKIVRESFCDTLPEVEEITAPYFTK